MIACGILVAMLLVAGIPMPPRTGEIGAGAGADRVDMNRVDTGGKADCLDRKSVV
jgi:hypothetical protein